MFLVPVATSQILVGVRISETPIMQYKTATEYEAHENLVDAIYAAGDDGLVFQLVAPDGVEHAKNALQVLGYVRENPGCTRSRLCRAMGKRFSRSVLDTLVGLGYIIENKERLAGSKKPTRTYNATKSGARVVR